MRVPHFTSYANRRPDDRNFKYQATKINEITTTLAS